MWKVRPQRKRKPALEKNDFGYNLLANLGIDEFCYPGLSHQQFMLERGGTEAHEKPALVYIDFLGLQSNSLAHHSLPTGNDRHFVKLALKAIGPD